MTIPDDVAVLRRELLGLFDRIQTIRREIASIRKPGDDRDRFATMSDELDAIVTATEGATNSIMENAEAIDEVIMAVRPTVTDPDAAARLDAIPDHIGGIFEACSFQDITGQRITKVVKTLQYIEKRVNALISVWGAAELSTVEPRDENDAMPPNDDRRFLNGPQLDGQGVSQSDVDAIMGTTLPDHAESPEAAPSAAERESASAPPSAAPPPSRSTPTAAPTPAASAPPSAGRKTPDAPAPSKPTKDAKDEGAAGLAQDDIDKLFG